MELEAGKIRETGVWCRDRIGGGATRVSVINQRMEGRGIRSGGSNFGLKSRISNRDSLHTAATMAGCWSLPGGRLKVKTTLGYFDSYLSSSGLRVQCHRSRLASFATIRDHHVV